VSKVLIVDDSNLARRSTRKILEEAGYQVVEAHDGLTALELYFTEKPSLTLLDVTMRDMDGIEVLKRIRELDSGAIAIIVTADVQSSTRDMATEAGAAGFVMKPVSPPILLAAVKSALEGGGLCN
jgi:two-component system, chemotaxis family, chemotaxis protein CheY